MKRARRSGKLHSDERILLLLWEHRGKRDLWDVPQDITQKGISKRLGILENNVSRSLKRLLKDGMVESELKHVKGEKRRQKAYFPTEKGEIVQGEIIQNLEKKGISVYLDGEEVKMNMLSAYRRARERGVGLTLVDLYLHGQESDSPFDLSPGWSRSISEEALIGNYQLPRSFYGRDEEMEEILAFQRSRSGVLVIWGLAGMGKTSLILKAMTDAGVRAGYTRCESWTDNVELMNDLASLMEEMGMDEISEDLMTGELTPGGLSRKIRRSSEELKGLTLIIDDLQKTGGGIDVYIEGLCRASMDSRYLKMVILTREKPTFLDPRYEIHGSVRTIELRGLDPRAVGLMIKASGKGGDVGAIWDTTKGHPLFIELYMSSIETGSRARFTGFLDQEIFSNLSPSQIRAVQLSALSGQPVHRALFRSTTIEDIEVLIRKGLLKEIEEEIYFLHDLLSDHVKGTIGPKITETLVQEIIAYRTAVIVRVWDDGPNLLNERLLGKEMELPKWLRDLIGNTHSSIVYEDVPGLRSKFRPYLDSNISMLIEIGHKQLALDLIGMLGWTSGRGRGSMLLGPINRLERARPSEDQLFKLRLLKAMLESKEGDMEDASRTIRLIEATYPENKIKGKERAQLQHLKGRISRSEERYEETISSHRAALKTYMKIGDKKAAARERLHLAKALHQGGMVDNAFKESIRSASEFEDVLDRKGEVYACLQAFRSALLMGKEKTAFRCLDRALEVSRSIGDRKLITMVELERLLDGEGGIDHADLKRIVKNMEHLDLSGRLLAAKGFLKLSGGMDLKKGMGGKLEILGFADEALETNDESPEPDDITVRLEISHLRIDLLEQLLEISNIVQAKDFKGKFEGGPFHLVEIKGGDMEGGILSALVREYEGALKMVRSHPSDINVDGGEIDGLYEGALHSLILAGIHFRDRKKKVKARNMFASCRRMISEYERFISRESDRMPGFDIRKVKEILEENRALMSRN